jgi:predicted lipoprotein with Yx(FWY)xxD motif
LSSLRPTVIAVAILVLAAAACGGGDGTEQRQADERPSGVTEPTDTARGAESDGSSAAPSDGARSAADARRPPGEEGLRVPAKRARIVVKQSPFGRILFDANGQAIYVFELDRTNRSNCTSEDCVKAWPPVLTREPPSVGDGANARLLGTIRRSDGSLQVTYNGRPLYFYEHEGPGEVKCHNVDLNGGLWWVVTPRGEPVA